MHAHGVEEVWPIFGGNGGNTHDNMPNLGSLFRALKSTGLKIPLLFRNGFPVRQQNTHPLLIFSRGRARIPARNRSNGEFLHRISASMLSDKS
jgi:hypothetical protein